MTSLRRGFTRPELSSLMARAGIEGRVYRRPGFRAGRHLAPPGDLMRTVDRLSIGAPVERVFQRRSGRRTVAGASQPLPLGAVAGAADRWRPGRDGRMAAVRAFSSIPPGGSRRCASTAAGSRFITATSAASPPGWTWSGGSQPAEGRTDVTIVHEWSGPRWPLIGGPAATWVIGPVFIHGIASRTLAGIAKHRGRGNEGMNGTRFMSARPPRGHHRHRRRHADRAGRRGALAGAPAAGIGRSLHHPLRSVGVQVPDRGRGRRLLARRPYGRAPQPAGSTASLSSASPPPVWPWPTRRSTRPGKIPTGLAR